MRWWGYECAGVGQRMAGDSGVLARGLAGHGLGGGSVKTLTDEEVRAILRKKVADDGSQAEVARKAGVTFQHVSLCLSGAPLSKKLLAYLGIEKFTGWRRLQTHQNGVSL